MAQEDEVWQQRAEPGSANERLNLCRYVTTENAGEYIQLMRLFTGTLLTDLSAAEAHDVLVRIDPDTALGIDAGRDAVGPTTRGGHVTPGHRRA
nr:hypothetical protein [Jiangella aurantiaca]